MKIFMTFLFNFFLVTLLIAVISVVYHMRVLNTDSVWLFYYVACDISVYVPLTAGLGIFWGLIIRNKSELEKREPASSLPFFILFYILIILSVGFLLSELLLPRLHQMSSQKSMLAEKKLDSSIVIKDTTGKDFTMKEFENTKYMPSKDNIAFYIENSVVYFEKMYNGNGAYYITGFKFIAYEGEKLDYVLTANYAKYVDSAIYAVNPVFMEFAGGKIKQIKKINQIKPIALLFDGNAIFSLTADYSSQVASLIDIFNSVDYIYASRINFYRLGNIVFNKISYYIITIVLLILTAGIGLKYRNKKLIQNEYFQVVCFYAASFVLIVLVYDILVSIANMVYGVIV